MKIKDMTKGQLLNELIKLRQLIAEWEKSETERKQLEEEVRGERDRAQKYLDVAGVMFVALDHEGEITLINKKGCKILGFKEKDIKGKNWFDNFLPEEIKDEMKGVYKKLMAGEIEPVEFYENPVLTKNGEQRIIAFYNSVLTDEAGNTIGTISSGEDITKRKQAEEELKSSEERLKILFEFAPDAYYLNDLKGNFIDGNIAAEKLMGYKKEELIGKSFLKLKLLPAGQIPIAAALLAKNMLRQPTGPNELILNRKDGDQVPVEIRTFPVNINGQTLVLGIARDITERRRAEDRIKASLQEKEVLLQEVHHRVKNNMQVISSLLNLQSRHIKDEQALEIFKNSQNRVRSMGFIHEKLYNTKDFARVDFNEYVRSLANHLFSSYGINKEAIKLNTNIKDVFLDINTAIPCGLIINELVSNSIKYGFPDGKKGEIKIAMLPLNKNKVELIVSDNGVGLPEEVDFRKTESLGLHLVTILAEGQLHGDIKLERGGGTSFHIGFKVKR